MKDETDWEFFARRFHEEYEKLAPDYGYKTREASAKPWPEVPANNRKLMTEVVKRVMGPSIGSLDEFIAMVDRVLPRWRDEDTFAWVTLEKAFVELRKRHDWSEAWYATRLESLKQLAEDQGFGKQFCDILANGSSHPLYPPTYAQLLGIQRHRAEKAEKERNEAYARGLAPAQTYRERAEKAEIQAAIWRNESQRGCWPKDAQVEIDSLRSSLAMAGFSMDQAQKHHLKVLEERDAALAALAEAEERLRDIQADKEARDE